MPRERGLLERLADSRPAAPRTIRQNESLLISSILEHLGKMLNTWRGNALVAPDYGLPDMADLIHSYPDAIRIMEQAIQTTIEKYEPRLSNIRVKSQTSEQEPFTLHFRVTAVVAVSSSNRTVSFRTKIDSNGEVAILE